MRWSPGGHRRPLPWLFHMANTSAKLTKEVVDRAKPRPAMRYVVWDKELRGFGVRIEPSGFASMLERIASNGVRVVIVETASRFARDLIVQETGFRFLHGLGVTLIAADSPDSFVDDTPTAVLIRQVLGAVSQFEKAALVAKLKGARQRKQRETGKCGGRKSYVERNAAMVAKAKELAQTKHGRSRSLRAIAADLEVAGHVSAKGTRFAPAAVARMLAA